MASAEGPRIKIQRAKKHIYELEAEIKGFLKRNPYPIFREMEPDTGRKLWRVRVSKQPPPRWSAIAGDGIHNLRSSLDLLVNQLVLANNNSTSDTTAFPIGWSVEDYEAKALRQIKGVSDTAERMIAELKPYKGGNDALWRLHRLDIADKHRLLIPVGAAHGNVILDVGKIAGGDWPSMRVGITPADRKCPLKDGDEVFGAPADFDADPEITVEIALNEPGVVEGEAVIPVLLDLADVVKRIVASFDGLVP
jgi:hypothetical protein